MRVATYTRVSTRDHGQDTANQQAQIEAFAQSQGWQIVARYSDQQSGARADRDQFRAMMAAATRREFDCVLFWSLDRFSREGVFETLCHLQRLTAAGVGYRSYTEQYLDSCGIFKDAVLSILATVAKQERVRIRERVMAGLERARASGRKPGRRPLVVDREAIKRRRAEGATISEIVREFGVSRGFVSRLGR